MPIYKNHKTGTTTKDPDNVYLVGNLLPFQKS